MSVEVDNQIWCAETRAGSGLIEILKIGGLSTHQPIIPDPTPPTMTELDLQDRKMSQELSRTSRSSHPRQEVVAEWKSQS